MPPLHADVIAALDERSSQQVANQLVQDMGQAGQRAGDAFTQGIDGRLRDSRGRFVRTGTEIGQDVSRAIDDATRNASDGLLNRFSNNGRQAAQNFGSAFGSNLAQSLPGVSGFASAMSGYESAAGKTGAAAGRAMGLAFTTAAAGLIGAAGYTLFKGFERYEAIDAATNRLENLNRTLEQTGRATIDVGAVMGTVKDVVQDTPFALDQAFSVAAQALSSNTGPLDRFMTTVADAAGYLQAPIDNVGKAFLDVAASGKVGMQQLSNELMGLPIDWFAQTMGKSTADITKMMEAGQVGLEDLMRAVEANVSGFAKGSVDTVQGQMDQVNTAVSRLGENFLGSVFGKPGEGANTMVEALKSVRERLDDVNGWVTEHQDDIRRVFEDGARVAGDLASTVMSVINALDDMGIGVDDVVKAFVAWQAIQGVTSLTNSLATIGTTLSVGLPDSANKGATGISAALARVNVPAWLLYLSSQVEDQFPNFPFQDQPTGEDRLFPGWVPILPAIEENYRRFTDEQPVDNTLPIGPSGPPSTGSGSQDVLGNLFNLQPGVNFPGGIGGGANAQRDRRGLPPGPSIPAGPGPAGGPILAPPGADGGSGSGPRLPPAPGVPYAELPAIDPRLQMTAGLFSAQTSVADARTRLAEKEARVRQLEATNEATADEIMNAKADRAKAEREATEADLRFTEAQQKAFEEQFKQSKKLNDGMGEIGAALDNDFGISDGLPGIADNLVRFVASLAAAPLLGQLSAVAQANPSQGGYGILGIAGAQGAFGPNFTGIDYEKQYGTTTAAASQMGPMALQPGMAGANPNLNAMMALAIGTSGKVDYAPASDLAKGLADCSGSISDLYEVLTTGQANSGRQFTTTNFASDAEAAKLGFLPGYMPGALNVGVNPYPGQSGHMAATLPNGVNYEGGGGTGGGGQYGGSAAGALDSQFEKQYYFPVNGMPTAATDPGVTAPSASADIFSPANTNPALTPPLAVPGTGGPGLAGAPTSAPFLPGPSPVFGPQGAAGGAGASTGLGSQQMAATPGGGGIGLGGGAMDALMGAAGAADLLMPGAGQAAQVGIKLANRGIQYAGQLAGIGVSGILQTLIPSGDNPASNIGNSWLGKLAGGIAGARPALPNQAGKSAPPPQQADPNTKQHGQAAGQAPGPTNGLYIDKFYGSQRDYETAAEMNRHAQHNQYTGVRR